MITFRDKDTGCLNTVVAHNNTFRLTVSILFSGVSELKEKRDRSLSVEEKLNDLLSLLRATSDSPSGLMSSAMAVRSSIKNVLQ
jgi:hypothetical protein